jgi:hypothetical protein
MGPCQGRVCGPALALLFGWDELDSVRGPLEPAALATLAGLGAAADPAPAGSGGLPLSIQHRDRGD